MAVLQDIIEKIKNVALLQPEVNAFGEGSVYELLNGGGGIERYAAVIATVSSVSIERNHGNYSIKLNLFYVDRLINFSKSENYNSEYKQNNRLQIQDTAIDVLNNIFVILTEDEDYEYNSITFTPFTENFADNCAGAYATLTISTSISTCGEDY